MKKKIITAMLTVTMIFASSSTAFADSSANSFSDVSAGHWAYKDIMALADAGVINGYADGTFKPNESVTDAEALKMVVSAMDTEIISLPSDIKYVGENETLSSTAKSLFGNTYPGSAALGKYIGLHEQYPLLGLTERAVYDSSGNQQFVIVDGTGKAGWYSPYATAAYKNNMLVQIYGIGHTDYKAIIGSGSLRKNNKCTRATVAKLVGRAIEIEDGDQFDETVRYWYRFLDSYQLLINDVFVDNYAVKNVTILYANGIANGKDKDNFRYNDFLTRAELAAIINRWINPENRLEVEDYIPYQEPVRANDIATVRYSNEQVNNLFLEGVNQARKEMGVADLRLSSVLNEAAKLHVNISFNATTDSYSQFHFGAVSLYGYESFTGFGFVDSLSVASWELTDPAEIIAKGKSLAYHSSQIAYEPELTHMGVSMGYDPDSYKSYVVINVEKEKDIPKVQNEIDEIKTGIYPNQEMVDYHHKTGKTFSNNWLEFSTRAFYDTAKLYKD